MRDESYTISGGGQEQPMPPANPGAVIIPFPGRAGQRSTPRDVVAALMDLAGAPGPNGKHHPATLLAAMGSIAGFAAQQSVLLEGGSAWTQPMRAEHLDRLLMSESRTDGSLWYLLCGAAHETGAHHLPEPQKLLASTLRCVGTNQFGVITLPLEYRLNEQPQTSLVRLWASVRETLAGARSGPSAWPSLTAVACARLIVREARHVPPHVSLRIVMQAALAMALIEPRLVPGSAVKSD